MFVRLRKPKILVIGSALIDTVAERTITHPLEENEPAKIIYSIGGSSYNIAVNLALERPRGGVVGLFSYLPPKATTTQLIAQRLRQLGVSTRYIRKKETVNERNITAGGFVAIRDRTDRHLFICGVEEVMGEYHLTAAPEEQRLLRKAMSGCKAVVVDTGLNAAAIAQIMDCAVREEIPVFVHLVSLKKVSNYLHALGLFKKIHSKCPTICLIGKAPELDALHKELGASTSEGENFVQRYMNSRIATTDTSGFDLAAICQRLQTRHIIVTPKRIEDAYLLTATPAAQHRIPLGLNVPDPEKGNLLGVSEAVGAAVIYQFCRQWKWGRPSHAIDVGRIGGRINETAHKFAHRAVSSLGATPLSVISRESDVDTSIPRMVKLRRWLDIGYSAITIAMIAWLAAALLGWLLGFQISHPRFGGP